MKQTYITTPIYYVNGNPHIGHAHTTVMGDILKRCELMKGNEVFFSTGTDEHGQKNQSSAEKSGLPVDEYLTGQSNKFRELFEALHVSFDYFVRTTAPHHKETVQYVLNTLKEKGLIVKKTYEGLYCEGCEMFKKKSDLDDKGNCPDHQAPPAQMTETNYFFKLAEHQEWLAAHIRENSDWIQPDIYHNELLNMLKEPLEDMCISRPKSRVSLGVELPFDSEYVTYVWFDALINYISNIGYPGDMEKTNHWWPSAIHLMAKDIIKTHCIYWPIMLKALGMSMPQKYRVHGYWVAEGGIKMSKSLNNVVDPHEIIQIYGADTLRFYLAKSMGKSEAQISVKLVQECYQSDLGNNIGNLYLRVVKMVARHFDNKVPECQTPAPEDQALVSQVHELALAAFPQNNLLSEINHLAKSVIAMGNAVNLHFDQTAPWVLAKDPEQKDRLVSVLYCCLETLRMIFEVAYPIMPVTGNRALAALGAKPIAEVPAEHRPEPYALTAGQSLGEAVVLFPKIE